MEGAETAGTQETKNTMKVAAHDGNPLYGPWPLQGDGMNNFETPGLGYLASNPPWSKYSVHLTWFDIGNGAVPPSTMSLSLTG